MSPGGPGEFAEIRRLFGALAANVPEALGLADDAAVLAPRPGCEQVLSVDAMVAGVHFFPDDDPAMVGERLVRAAASDLAAKGAEPDGALLTIAWPGDWTGAMRGDFARGFGQGLAACGLRLLGGDTVSTPGPLVANLAVIGWAPAGGTVKRSGASAGDLLLVSGTIGDATLGLALRRGALDPQDTQGADFLLSRWRRPSPRFELRAVLRAHAAAAADISDGLLADALHIAEASGLGLEIDLDRLPLSAAAAAWLAKAADAETARLHLAGGGDDYELAMAVAPGQADGAMAAATAAGAALQAVGVFVDGGGLKVRLGGRLLTPSALGFQHL